MLVKLEIPKCRQFDCVRRKLVVGGEEIMIPNNQKEMVVEFPDFPITMSLTNIGANGRLGSTVSREFNESDYKNRHDHLLNIKEVMGNAAPVQVQAEDKDEDASEGEDDLPDAGGDDKAESYTYDWQRPKQDSSGELSDGVQDSDSEVDDD